MKRLLGPLLAATATLLAISPQVLADTGQASPTLSFFSGGGGARADWLATSDQPSGDSDNQAIRLLTTTASNGYAGILVHHVTGIPAASFPDSSFWLKAPPNNGSGATFGSPRLVVEFQNSSSEADGNAELDQNIRGTGWQEVSDVTDYPNSGWDIHSATCPFAYHQKWSMAQSCHAGDTVSVVFLVADPYGISHLIDDISVDGKTFTDAADNSNGDNAEAGPDPSEPSLIPPSLLAFPGL
jgi:hypothetical protein